MAVIGTAILPTLQEQGLEEKLAQSGWTPNGTNTHNNGRTRRYDIDSGIAKGTGYLRTYQNQHPEITGLTLIVVADSAEMIILIQGEARQMLYEYVQSCAYVRRRHADRRIREPEKTGA